MAVFAVTFDGTRFNLVDNYTNWSNYGGSGAGGAVEPSLAYHNSNCAARKQSVSGGTLGGMQLNDASTVNMTLTDRFLWFFKVYVADAFDVNLTEGVRVGIGDGGSSSSRSYNLSGTTATNDAYLAYPQQGGYILGCIEPSNTFWPIATAGTPDLTIIDFFGCQGSWIEGNAKSLNLAMDAIDIGVGLYLTGGTGGDPVASFVSYPEIDQNIQTNRWGVCSGAGDNVSAWGILRAGGTIEFLDETSVVAFKDGYHGAGYTGLLHELDTAAATFTMGATVIGEGKLYNAGAIDTRPDYVISGTTMTDTYHLTGDVRNFRNITLNSKVDADGAILECQLLTQATAEIQNCTIKTDALTSIACLQDPTFGTITGLHDTDFVQSGAGHALEIDTAGNYTFTLLTFTGYGADTTDDAAIDITETTSIVTINYTGTAPTFKTAGAEVVLIGAAATTKITVQNETPILLQNARVFIETADDGGTGFPYQDAVTSLTQSAGVATLTSTAVHGLSTGDFVVVRGAQPDDYNKVAEIIVTTTFIFTYSVDSGIAATATGTPVYSYVPIQGLTDVNGEISSERAWPASQSLTGWARLTNATSPFYKQAAIVIADASGGTDLLVTLLDDE